MERGKKVTLGPGATKAQRCEAVSTAKVAAKSTGSVVINDIQDPPRTTA